jgi:hypothetical protein
MNLRNRELGGGIRTFGFLLLAVTGARGRNSYLGLLLLAVTGARGRNSYLGLLLLAVTGEGNLGIERETRLFPCLFVVAVFGLYSIGVARRFGVSDA